MTFQFSLAANKPEIIFSLILATYNRKEEVACFIDSLLHQDFDLNKIELIIVDQNKDDLLLNLINSFKKYLNIVHIKSEILGLSVNRNIGIKIAKGNILSFPDDDCTYHDNTLSEVYHLFSESNVVTTVLGQIIDDNGNKIIRNWPNHAIKITPHNFFTLYSSITIFTQCKDCYFDIRLGVGNKYGSYEDADYILALLKADREAMYYYPDVKVSHPQLNITTMPPGKIINYGLGFGAFCKKNLSPAILFLYLNVIAYHSAMMGLALLRLNYLEFKKRYLSIISRIKGFIVFN